MNRAIEMLGSSFNFKEVGFEENVYALVDFKEVIYVGKSKNLDERLKQHRQRGLTFSAVFYKSFSTDVSSLIEFYLINKLNPKENKYDVVSEDIKLDRLIEYFHRFTHKELINYEINTLFDKAKLTHNTSRKYTVDDLFNLCVVGFEEIKTDHKELSFDFIYKWKSTKEKLNNNLTLDNGDNR